MRLSIAIALGIAFGFALIPAATSVVTAVPRWSMRIGRAMRSIPLPSRRQLARVSQRLILAGLVVALLVAWVACDRALHCPTC